MRRSFFVLAAWALILVPVPGRSVRAQDQANPEAKSAGIPAIIGPVSSGNVAGVKAVLAANPAQANTEGPGRMTPLGLALTKKSLVVVQALLDGGADPNKPFGPLQMHPLQAAAASGRLDAVKTLLERGARAGGKDVNGGTALHAAALYGHVEIVRLLLENGADVNAPFTAGPNRGATPLHLAARSNNLLAVMALHVPQSDWGLKWNGRTPAELADSVGARATADYIRSRQSVKK